MFLAKLTMYWLPFQVVVLVTVWAIPSVGVTTPLARESHGAKCPEGDLDLTELGKKLSNTGKIYCPGSTKFEEASTRWSILDAPKVNVVVVPGTENDVVETVCWLFSALVYNISCCEDHCFQMDLLC